MENSSFYLLAGDLGGTNVRYQVLQIFPQTKHAVTLQTFHKLTRDSKGVAEDINEFLDSLTSIERSQVTSGVVAICGPVESDGVAPIMVDVPQWGEVREKDLSTKCNIPQFKLVNDFVGNGYGIFNLPESDIIRIYQPEELQEDKMRIVIGVGTGLGFCYMTRPSVDKPYCVYPSEVGFMRINQYNKRDRQYVKFLQEVKLMSGFGICDILAGYGLPLIAEFLANHSDDKAKYESSQVKDFRMLKPKDITRLAKEEKDVLCIDTIEYFMDYTAKFITDTCTLFLPYGGVYLTSTVYQACSFIFENQTYKEAFLGKVQNRGNITDIMKKMPISIVMNNDLAILGCANYAMLYFNQ